MLLDEIKRKVDETAGGIACFKLGNVIAAYARDRELSWKKASRPRVDDLRAELAGQGYMLWPEEFEDHHSTQNVYVISRGGLVGAVSRVLSGAVRPDPIVCDVLNEILGRGRTGVSA